MRPVSAAALTEMCGLSAEHGPEIVGLGEYRRLVGSKATVDAIIGTALKAKLRSMDAERWDFGDEDQDQAVEADEAVEAVEADRRADDEDQAAVEAEEAEESRRVKRSRGREETAHDGNEAMAVD